jgi:hypothetical protein
MRRPRRYGVAASVGSASDVAALSPQGSKAARTCNKQRHNPVKEKKNSAKYIISNATWTLVHASVGWGPLCTERARQWGMDKG